MATIALVDDDRNILTSVSMVLEAEGFDVQTYTDGATALTALSRSVPDLAVLDIKMPRMDGMELLRRLRQKSDLPVIFLTSKDEEIDELIGLRMGADDYVRKPFRPKEVMARIRAVLRRTAGAAGEAPGEILSFPPLVLDDARHEVTLDGREVNLTATEYRILNYMMSRPERVFTRSQLLSHVSSDARGSAGRSIDVHIRSLRKALGQHAAMIETARGVGYRFRPVSAWRRDAVTTI